MDHSDYVAVAALSTRCYNLFMKHESKRVIQIGGSGKGCGKTSLVELLLAYFPGAVFVKSARHTSVFSAHGGDDIRCAEAGASQARMIDQSDAEMLQKVLKESEPENGLIFVEKNRVHDSMEHDYYIYLDIDVDSPRADRAELRSFADFIVETYPVEQEVLIQLVERIKELLVSVDPS